MSHIYRPWLVVIHLCPQGELCKVYCISEQIWAQKYKRYNIQNSKEGKISKKNNKECDLDEFLIMCSRVGEGKVGNE